MHIPDGFLSLPVWSAMDGAAVPSVAWLARRAQQRCADHRIPLMGVMGAFVFAAQMINFPVGSGTSAHLLGGALLSFTLGPAPASIVMTAILAIQALVFQDGGLLALGANVFNMAIAGVAAGYLPYALLKGRPAGMFLGGLCSVMVSGVLALSELRISGVPMPRMMLAISIVVFVVAGVCEGVITMAVTRALVRRDRGLIRQPGMIGRRRVLSVVAASLMLAVAGVFVTSARPDGIQKIIAESGLGAKGAGWFAAPIAGYNFTFPSISLSGSSSLTKILAALTGVFLVYLLCASVARLFRAPDPSREEGA
jgi:cobalt/nickel transport system permease protein